MRCDSDRKRQAAYLAGLECQPTEPGLILQQCMHLCVAAAISKTSSRCAELSSSGTRLLAQSRCPMQWTAMLAKRSMLVHHWLRGSVFHLTSVVPNHSTDG